jgi:hypothetical protein
MRLGMKKSGGSKNSSPEQHGMVCKMEQILLRSTGFPERLPID